MDERVKPIAAESNLPEDVAQQLCEGGNEKGLFIFARFHAHIGNEGAVAETLLEVLVPTREEPGCLRAHTFRSVRDPQLFFIHSHWKDEAAFNLHVGLPHTIRFIERIEPLLDHPLDVVRTQIIGCSS